MEPTNTELKTWQASYKTISEKIKETLEKDSSSKEEALKMRTDLLHEDVFGAGSR